jgi:hypothetical protein
MGSGVHPANGRYLKQMASDVLFQLARLMASSHEFRDIIRMYCPVDDLMGTVPGVVKHRLMIKPALAQLVRDYLPAILQALAGFNRNYCRGKWKHSTRQTTTAHAEEVGLARSTVRARPSLLPRHPPPTQHTHTSRNAEPPTHSAGLDGAAASSGSLLVQLPRGHAAPPRVRRGGF